MFWLAEVFNGGVSQDEMRRRELWARRQRAETVRGLLAAAGSGLVRGGKAGLAGLAALAAGIRRAHQRRAAIRELQGLSDHTLKDIGLSRGEIRTVVQGLMSDRREVTTATGAVIRPYPARGRSTGAADAESDWQRAA